MALQPAVMTVSNVYDEHLKLVTVAGRAMIFCVRGLHLQALQSVHHQCGSRLTAKFINIHQLSIPDYEAGKIRADVILA